MQAPSLRRGNQGDKSGNSLTRSLQQRHQLQVAASPADKQTAIPVTISSKPASDPVRPSVKEEGEREKEAELAPHTHAASCALTPSDGGVASRNISHEDKEKGE